MKISDDDYKQINELLYKVIEAAEKLSETYIIELEIDEDELTRLFELKKRLRAKAE
jgi:hypothetical protein